MLCFQTYQKISRKKGTRGVRTRYDTVLFPLISIARCPGRPVVSTPENPNKLKKEVPLGLVAPGSKRVEKDSKLSQNNLVSPFQPFALQSPWPLAGVLRARSPQKVEEGIPGPLAFEVKKGRKKVKNESNSFNFFQVFHFFNLFLTFFQPFLTPGPRGPGPSFSTSWGISARMAPARGQLRRL